MKFEEWMNSENLAESSVYKYHTAIKGVLSDWAKKAGIIEDSLLDISDVPELSNVVLEIRKLPIFKARDSDGNQMYTASLNKYAQFLSFVSRSDIETDIEDILKDEEIKQTDKVILVNARIGQGKYRTELIGLWGACSLTGYKDTSLLVASHIKPWSHSSNNERLDPHNGLLLLPNLDKAFDKGLISFNKKGQIIISRCLDNAKMLGIKNSMSVKLTKENTAYIDYHRKNIFEK